MVRSLAPQRVLVASAVQPLRKSLCKYVRAVGHEAVEADSGNGARERLLEAVAEGRRFEHLFIDGGFPRSEVCGLAAIGKVHPQLLPLSIVILTPTNADLAYTNIGDAKRLRKPLRVEHLQSLFDSGAGEHARTAGQSPDRAAARGVLGRALIAEDNSVNQRLSARLAKKCGFAADVVSNGVEAVEAVRNNHYDLILMDCQMPEMDGWAATGRIRAMGGPVSQTPIIALTANAMGDDRERCLAAGMDEYLSKPVNLADLEAAIGKVLARPFGAPGGGTHMPHTIPEEPAPYFQNPGV